MMHTIFFDLDNTLYPRGCGVWDAISERINLFIKKILDLDDEKVQEMRLYFRQNYSTSLQGLKSLCEVDENDYLDFVHDVDLSKILPADNLLSETLAAIPQRKIIFTNSDHVHANNVLDILRVKPHFDFVIDIHSINPFVKPQEEAFLKALDLAGLHSAEGCAFIDDMIENVEQAKSMGFMSILIGSANDEFLSIPDIHQLPNLLSSMN